MGLEDLRAKKANGFEMNNESQKVEGPKVCPKCGSDKFHYELVSGKVHSFGNNNAYGNSYNSTGSNMNTFSVNGNESSTSHVTYKSVGICPDCGYTENESNELSTGAMLALLVGMAILGVLVFFFL